ncbi:MAG: hypothetical protein IJ253_01330 [Bacteroidaceae bacterium]|nr:hypothetical protein [Bacteroidaceae bacterium]
MKNVLRLMILLCMTALPALNRAQGWTNPIGKPLPHGIYIVNGKKMAY